MRQVRFGMLWVLLLILPSITLYTVQAQSDSLTGLPLCNFALSGQDVPALFVGAVVLNIETGQGCIENPDLPFPIASVPKLFVLGALYEAIALDLEQFDTAIRFTDYYLMDGSDACLTSDDLGTRFTLGYLSEIMITCSDNAATWMIMDTIGWQAVQNYVARQGISGVGEIIPYSEVDRLKLTLLDERWANVPRSLASQYYRRQRTDGLVPLYFDEIPEYTREQRREANARYFNIYSYNTATPRALAQYILKLRDELDSEDPVKAQVAWWVFNTMILTQRQHSAQAMPGTVFVGGKNGFDTGLTAEVSIMLHRLDTRAPGALAVVFSRQMSLTGDDVQRPGQFDGPLNTFLRRISPRIVQRLYPNVSVPRVDKTNSYITTFAVNSRDVMAPCWQPYVASNYSVTQLNSLDSCWLSLAEPESFAVDTWQGVGLILRGMEGRNARMTLMYTGPDGQQFSYQAERLERDASGIFWFHEPNQAGIWQIDIYQNLQRVGSHLFIVE